MIRLEHLPLDYIHVTYHFGPRNYKHMLWHNGIDLRAPIGTPVYAVADGMVEVAKNNPGGYGLYVVINHKDIFGSLSAHLSQYNVSPGQKVKAGDIIGLSGNTGDSTGPHLHFEIRLGEYSTFWTKCPSDDTIYMYCINPLTFMNRVLMRQNMTPEEAKEVVQYYVGLEDKTLNYIAELYKYGGDLITKLAKAII